MYAETVFHAVILLYYAVVNHYVVYGMNNAHSLLERPLHDALVNRMLGGSATYYTCWNLAIQESYFILRLIEDVFEFIPMANVKGLRKWTRMMLSVFVAPGSCAVVFMFWSVYAVSPSLVYGDFLDVINPVWVNHAIHTNVALIALLELYWRAKSDDAWDGGYMKGILSLTAFLIFYTITISLAYLAKGSWPYPLLDYIDCYSFFPSLFAGLSVFLFWYSFCYYAKQKFQGINSQGSQNKIKKKKF